MAMHCCLLIAPRLDEREREESVSETLYTMLSSLMVITVKREIEYLYMIKRESVGIWLRLSQNAAICSVCAISLPLPQQLSGKNIQLVFSKS